MTIYYANPAGSNTSPYDTLAKGATDYQTVADLAQAGDTIRSTGTFELAASPGAITIDTYAGNTTSGYINHIGVNSSDVIDGTRTVFDGNGLAESCLAAGTFEYHWMENFEFKKATGNGVDASLGNPGNWIFKNCISHSHGGAGWYWFKGDLTWWIGCTAHSNSGDGFAAIDGFTVLIFCCSRDNGGNGIDGSYASGELLYNLFYNNTSNGIEDAGHIITIGNIAHNNGGNGINLDSTRRLLLGNRITGNTTGLDFASLLTIHGYNYLENTTNYSNATLAEELTDLGGNGTNQEDTVGETDYGYTSLTAGSEDFNLRSDATLRRVAIPIPDAN